MRHLRNLLALLAAVLGASVLPAEPYVRLAGSMVHFHNGGFSDHAGYAAELGTAWGASGAHELGLEFGGTQWGYRRTVRPSVGPGSSSVVAFDRETGDGEIRPILATYRFRFGRPESRLRWHVAVQAGWAKVDGAWYRSTSGVTSAGPGASFDRWRFARGGGVGVSYAVGRRGALELAYRFQMIDGTEGWLGYRGDHPHVAVVYPYKMPRLETSTVQLGYSLRF